MPQLARVTWRAVLTRPLTPRDIRDAIRLHDHAAHTFAIAGLVEYHDACCCGSIAGDTTVVFEQLEALGQDLWYHDLQVTGYHRLQRNPTAGWRSTTQAPTGQLRCFCTPARP